jgi:pilus assembly protein Flp/PilA
MKTLKTIAGRFHADEDGAAMIEYSILIGIIAVATITAVISVGGWVTTQWAALDLKLV